MTWEGHPGAGEGVGICTAERRKGGRCTARCVAGYDVCNFHIGNNAKEYGTKGNKSRNKIFNAAVRVVKGELLDEDMPAMNFTTADGVLQAIQDTAALVLTNRIRFDQAQMVAYLGSVALSAQKAAARAGEGSDKPMPEIRVIERSADPRAASEDYPGSEAGDAKAN